MKEQVIVTKIRIIRGSSQSVYFQIKLPPDAIRIIGIETGFGFIRRVNNGECNSPGGCFPFPSSEGLPFGSFIRCVLLGELKLQSQSKENIFYSKHLQSDENLAVADFSKYMGWEPQQFTHQARAEEESISIDTCGNVIHGIYADKLGPQTANDYDYTVHIYLWVELEQKQKDDDCTCP